MSLASAHIQKYGKNSDGHVEYFIKVFYLGKEWGIRKRYKDFVKFDEYFRTNHEGSLTCELPPKEWWKRSKSSKLYRRQKGLQQYLDALLTMAQPTEVSIIREFLEVDVYMLNFARKQSFQEFKFSNRMQDIINETREAMVGVPTYVVRSNSTQTNGKPTRPRGVSITQRAPSHTGFSAAYGSHVTSSSSGLSLMDPSLLLQATAGGRANSMSRSMSLTGSKWFDASPSGQSCTSTADRLPSSDKHSSSFFASSLSPVDVPNPAKEAFSKHVANRWEDMKDISDDILRDFEKRPPYLSPKEVSSRGRNQGIYEILCEPVCLDFCWSEDVLAIVDSLFEASNAVSIRGFEDVVQDIDVTPRAGRMANRLKPGLARKPRVDRSPSSQKTSSRSRSNSELTDGGDAGQRQWSPHLSSARLAVSPISPPFQSSPKLSRDGSNIIQPSRIAQSMDDRDIAVRKPKKFSSALSQNPDFFS